MPIFVVPALVALFEALVGVILRVASMRGFAWLAGSAAVQGWALAKPEEFKAFRTDFYEFGAAIFLEFGGISLSKTDPFSDASICNALGEKTGIALRTVKDRESIREDVEHWALASLEAKTGLHIRNLRDKPGVVKDVMRFASPVVAEATGLPLSDISDAETVKAEITNHLKDRALVLLSQDIDRVKSLVGDALGAAGTTMEQLLDDVVRKGGVDPVTGQSNVKIDITMIALSVLARALIVADKRRRDEESARQKGSRRAEQMRGALKRFREVHGSRMHYEGVL